MRTGNAGHSVDVLTGTLQRDRGLVRGEVCLEQTPQPPSSSARRPIRALAVAATDKWAAGNQEPTAGIGRREARYLAARRRPGEVAARRRSWIAAQWCALHRPAPRASPAGHPPPAVHPHPHAGGRGDGRRAAERRPASGCGSALWRHSLADFGHRKAIARRNRATGGQAHDGASARRRKCARVSRRTDLRTRAEGDGGAQCRPAKTNCERATLKPRLQCTPLPPE